MLALLRKTKTKTKTKRISAPQERVNIKLNAGNGARWIHCFLTRAEGHMLCQRVVVREG